MASGPQRVTVIIPAFNAGKYLRKCLASIEGDPAIGEILVVDNASSDDSVAVVRSCTDPRIRLIESPENVGASRARHLAMGEARHELVSFLDADDFLSRGAVSAAAARIAEADLDMSIFEMVRTDEGGETVTPFIKPPREVITGDAAFLMTLAGWRIHPMGVFRKSVYLAAMREAAFHGFSDDELITRLMFLSARRVGGNGGTYFYRHVVKPVTQAKRTAQAWTEIKAFALALERIEAPYRQPSICSARDLVVRRIFAFAIRGLGVPAYAREAKALRDVYRALSRTGSIPLRTRMMSLIASILLAPRRS